jgi:iron(III) transport system permease protein
MRAPQSRWWRTIVGASLLLVVGIPLADPIVRLIREPQWFGVWREGPRVLGLLVNTVTLTAGALALSLPIGTAAAILLFRTDIPSRVFFRRLLVLLLFVPLPLTASAWQSFVGLGGWLGNVLSFAPVPSAVQWRPWAHGLLPAVALHTAAALPWIIWIVGLGLGRVERELEEDALTAASVAWVIRRVTLRRSAGAVVAAALWVTVQTATEITVTDVMQVNTFAEETYTQLVAGDEGGVVRSVALAAPMMLGLGVVLGVLAAKLARSAPPLETVGRPPPAFRLGAARGLASIVVCAVMFAVAVPLAGLVWKAGGGDIGAWTPSELERRIMTMLRVRGMMVTESLLLAVATGASVAVASLLAAWLGLGTRLSALFVLVLTVAAVAEPGPVAGLGLKETIDYLVGLAHSDLAARVLYYGPSLVPVWWAGVIRFFPYGVFLLWPVVRTIPLETRETARIDGATPGVEFRSVIWPIGFSFLIQTTFAVAALSLGEIAAGKLVETPGAQTLAHEIFNQMHYGVSGDLAAVGLVLLGMVLLSVGLAFLARLALEPNKAPVTANSVAACD